MRNIVGNNLKRIRKMKGVNIPQLAEQIDVNKESIYAWERGDYQPNEENLHKIAEALGVSVRDFYEEEGKEGEIKSAPEEIYRDLVEANSEYRLVPKVILEGKYVIVLESQVGKTEAALWETLRTKDELIKTLKDEIADFRSSRTSTENRK